MVQQTAVQLTPWEAKAPYELAPRNPRAGQVGWTVLCFLDLAEPMRYPCRGLKGDATGWAKLLWFLRDEFPWPPTSTDRWRAHR